MMGAGGDASQRQPSTAALPQAGVSSINPHNLLLPFTAGDSPEMLLQHAAPSSKGADLLRKKF